MNMVWLLFLFSLLLCCSTAKAQEPVEFLPLHDSTTLPLQSPSLNGQPLAVQVETESLKNVSKSVLMAETWLRNYVLPFYPSTNITTIIVGHSVFCNKDQENNMGFILPAIKNIHYSLTRWGLQNDIKVASSFSSNCLDSKSENYRVDLAENYIKPLLTILEEINSPYVINPSPHLSDETLSLLKTHFKSMKNLGDFHLNRVSGIILSPRKEKPTNRKLSFIDISKNIVPFPAYNAKSPLPPLIGTISPTPYSFPPESNPRRPPPFLPHLAPMASPPYGPHLPPCDPSGGGGGGGGGSVGAPVGGVHNELWCVAKPTVPPETLQEALDYACGDGGADCEAIGDGGSCYFPDTVVAHASYAFNSYWQKNKRSGGTCGFGGTAMLINSDPSYRRCRFSLS
ncbi:hypothetical protein DH2020_040994 [Rehmannia glutinosa]|uniref:X8 domain-containing protein n=1 Tax=Rehmannia glutinosa TaxID=99300 RepID=A0ABR0UTI0_REHGL